MDHCRGAARHGDRSTYTFRKGAAGTDEETSTDGASNGNHVEVATPHGAVELDDTEAIVALLEGREVEAIPGPEVLLADGGSGILGSIVTAIPREDLRGGLDGDLLEVRIVRRQFVARLHDVESPNGDRSSELLVDQLLCLSRESALTAGKVGLIAKDPESWRESCAERTRGGGGRINEKQMLGGSTKGTNP